MKYFSGAGIDSQEDSDATDKLIKTGIKKLSVHHTKSRLIPDFSNN